MRELGGQSTHGPVTILHTGESGCRSSRKIRFPACGKMQYRSPVLTLHVVRPVSSSLRQTRIGSGIVVLWQSCLHVCSASWHPAGSHLQYAVTPSSVILQHTAQVH